jgi:hypothetical protein
VAGREIVAGRETVTGRDTVACRETVADRETVAGREKNSSVLDGWLSRIFASWQNCFMCGT